VTTKTPKTPLGYDARRNERRKQSIGNELRHIDDLEQGIQAYISQLENLVEGEAELNVGITMLTISHISHGLHVVDVECNHVGKLLNRLGTFGPVGVKDNDDLGFVSSKNGELQRRYETVMRNLYSKVQRFAQGVDYDRITNAIRSGLVSTGEFANLKFLLDDVLERTKELHDLFNIDVLVGDMGTVHPELENRFLWQGQTRELIKSAYAGSVPSGRRDLYRNVERIKEWVHVYKKPDPEEDNESDSDAELVDVQGPAVYVKSVRIDRAPVFPGGYKQALQSIREVADTAKLHRSVLADLSTRYEFIKEYRKQRDTAFQAAVDTLEQSLGGLSRTNAGNYSARFDETEKMVANDPWLTSSKMYDTMIILRKRWKSALSAGHRLRTEGARRVRNAENEFTDLMAQALDT